MIIRCITLRDGPLQDILSRRKTMEIRSIRVPIAEGPIIGIHANMNCTIAPGHIVALARIGPTLRFNRDSWEENRYRHQIDGDLSYGMQTFGWPIEEIILISPISARGQLGAWRYDIPDGLMPKGELKGDLTI